MGEFYLEFVIALSSMTSKLISSASTNSLHLKV